MPRPSIWRLLRHVEGLSLDDIAERSGLDPAIICRIETGKKAARDDQALRLVRAYEAVAAPRPPREGAS
jgi:hypothetical protein